ncbi:MAG: hypothetical protein AAB669_02285 [Patescibacteria group bacterium]
MTAALFFNGSVRFPSSLPLIQTIQGKLANDSFGSIEIVRLTASQQRRKVSDSVRQTYDDFFGSRLNGRGELIARIICFLSGVEAVFEVIESFDDQPNELILLDGFRLLVREAFVYNSSGMTDSDKIWLKYQTRQATSAIINDRKLDLLVLVSLGEDGARKIVTDAICDKFANGKPCLWANEVIPVLNNDLINAAQSCTDSLKVHAANYMQVGRAECPIPSPV